MRREYLECMKSTGVGRRLLVVAVSMVLLLMSAIVAAAASLTWDATPGTGGVEEGGGDWNTTGNNWWTGSANTTWNNGTPDQATFGAGGGGSDSFTVNLTAPVTASTITFNAGASYTLSGGTLTKASGGIYVNAPEARIDSDITGSAFHKYGTGKLILTGDNSFGTGASQST